MKLAKTIGFVFVGLITLLIFPGIDIIAYHFLHSSMITYWEKLTFIVGIVLTLFPMGVAAFFAMIFMAAFVENVLD